MRGLEIYFSLRRFEKFKPELSAVAEKVLKRLRRKGRVEICLLEDKEMRKLNLRFRGKNKTASVLAFPAPRNFVYHPPFSRSRMLGEIFLAPDYIRKTGADLRALLIHGLLHLLGYDHQAENDRIRMEAKERELILKIKDQKF